MTSSTPIANGFLLYCAAGAAIARSIPSDICVLCRVRMAISAMRASLICGGTRTCMFSSSNILFMCDGFKVSRINAGSVAAQMVKLLTVWNFAYEMFIGYAMGLLCFSSKSDGSIFSPLISAACPYPARRSVLLAYIYDLVKESRKFVRCHVVILA